jgi:hypothetical protein
MGKDVEGSRRGLLQGRPDICLQAPSKATKYLSHDSRFAGRDSNRGSVRSITASANSPWSLERLYQWWVGHAARRGQGT